jgi:hypothetical protein
LKLGLDNKKGVRMGQGRSKRKQQVLERGWRRKRAGEWMDEGGSRRKATKVEERQLLEAGGG